MPGNRPNERKETRERLGEDQSPTDLPAPALLDTAFVEMVEGCEFHWPESLEAEGVHVGIAEIAAAALALAGFVVLGWRTISILILLQSFSMEAAWLRAQGKRALHPTNARPKQ